MNPDGSSEVDCPVCLAPCLDPPVFRYSPERSAAHFCPPQRDADRNRRLRECIGRLWSGHECAILHCAGCGFSFGHPFVGGDEEFYDILLEQQGFPSWRWDYDVAISEVIDRSPGGRVLDIGAGTGKFLAALPETWERFATEGSESTRAQLEDKGIRVFRSLREAANERAGTFDVVTMFQLLEHVAEFRELLGLCRELLRPGSRLVITVPDGAAMLRQEHLTGHPDMPPFHINKWTPGSLSRVLSDAGFKAGAAIQSPTRWKNLIGAAHLRILSDASRPGSIAAQVYRLKRRPLRMPLLAALALPAFLRVAPHWRHLRRGGAFAMIAGKGP